jgi:hypothetical protein
MAPSKASIVCEPASNMLFRCRCSDCLRCRVITAVMLFVPCLPPRFRSATSPTRSVLLSLLMMPALSLACCCRCCFTFDGLSGWRLTCYTFDGLSGWRLLSLFQPLSSPTTPLDGHSLCQLQLLQITQNRRRFSVDSSGVGDVSVIPWRCSGDVWVIWGGMPKPL